MRYRDWHKRFRVEADAAQSRAWEWGVHDCCVFVARMVDAISINSYADQLQRKFTYSSEAEAAALVKAGGGLRLMVSAYLGDEVPWGRACMGDVVLTLDGAGTEVLGMCEGSQVLVAAARGGVIPIPFGRSIAAWKVE
jgi:GMP synthase-like glutamine amidotransferase